MEDTLQTTHVEFKMADGIVVASYRPKVHIDLAVARQIVEDRHRFTAYQPYPVLINSQGVVQMDKDARDYLSSPEGTKGLKAAAILVSSPFSSFLGNFFVWVNRTTLPVKIFSKPQTALRWLSRYV